MKKVIVILAALFITIGIVVVIGVMWERTDAQKEAEQLKSDARFYAEQKAKTDEANKKQAEYNKSVGRPDYAN